MSLNGEIVDLAAVELHPLALAQREGAIAAKAKLHAKKPPDPAMTPEEAHEKSFPIYDWQRLCYVFSRLNPGERCLEVGPGRGHLTTMMSRSGLYSQINAIDIMVRRAFPSSVDFRIMSVAEMEFEDRTFDTVLCMEVLEHLEDQDFQAGLKEIRRVCRGQLIVSVPYKEPLPLPQYHKQAFDERRIRELFPRGKFHLLLKSPISRIPWLIVEEDYRA